MPDRSQAGSARSATMGSATPPSAAMSSATSWSEPARCPPEPGSRLRATMATRAPSAAKRRAMAAPIPRLAPVTIATLPVSASLMGLRPPALHQACGVASPTGPPDLRLAAHQRLDNSCEVPPRRFRVRLRRGARRRGARVVLDIGPDLDERDAARVRDVVTHLLQRHDTATERADIVAIAEAYG